MERVTIPDIGDAEEIKLVEWNFEEGQDIKSGDELAVIETMKSLFSIEAPVSGVLEEIEIEAGRNVEKGQEIAQIKESR